MTVAVEPTTLREVLAHFASGVVVVTAAGPEALADLAAAVRSSAALQAVTPQI